MPALALAKTEPVRIDLGVFGQIGINAIALGSFRERAFRWPKR